MDKWKSVFWIRTNKNIFIKNEYFNFGLGFVKATKTHQFVISF